MSETTGRSGEESARDAGRPGPGPGRRSAPVSGRPTDRELDRAETVLVNGAVLEWPAPGTIADLLARLGMQDKRVAVSIDRNVIPRSRHGEAPVRAGDRIEILEAVGGG